MTKPIVCIRQFLDDDLPEIAEIFEYGMMLYAKDNSMSRHCWREYVRKSLTADLADNQGTYLTTGGNFWVATVKDNNGESKGAGMIALEPKGNGEGEVRRVSVHSGYQRMGIGRELMTHLVHWATTHNFKTLTLNTALSESTSSVAFYNLFGFKSGETVTLWENPTQEIVWMRKTLP
ncbi:hypothetical protein PF004_g21056 [Phytophthora fragariae]|uniref:N-acetyltransferase domain-containing protein n=1 Tax=Phytophthora fragariae TaxID=53985 RepID=A0A6G0N418_9STRA|nr:hypothetical protein PF004_g21056 [Phytophthora fragariae]